MACAFFLRAFVASVLWAAAFGYRSKVLDVSKGPDAFLQDAEAVSATEEQAQPDPATVEPAPEPESAYGRAKGAGSHALTKVHEAGSHALTKANAARKQWWADNEDTIIAMKDASLQKKCMCLERVLDKADHCHNAFWPYLLLLVAPWLCLVCMCCCRCGRKS